MAIQLIKPERDTPFAVNDPWVPLSYVTFRSLLKSASPLQQQTRHIDNRSSQMGDQHRRYLNGSNRPTNGVYLAAVESYCIKAMLGRKSTQAHSCFE